jgi:hypothetical protein
LSPNSRAKGEKMNADLETAPASVDNPEDMLVHEWRRERLASLGLAGALADAFADVVDWHVVADLVGCGCPPYLALRIAW